MEPSWEQEQSKLRRKWQAERKKESLKKEEGEKDSDSPESPPDSTETQEVRLARDHLVTLTTEQKKIQRQKVRAAINLEQVPPFPPLCHRSPSRCCWSAGSWSCATRPGARRSCCTGG